MQFERGQVLTCLQAAVAKARKTKLPKNVANANYIPALARAKAGICGMAVCYKNKKNEWEMAVAGDNDTVAIESTSKVFTLAAVLARVPIKSVLKQIGAHGSFFNFGSENNLLQPEHKLSSFYNMGAIATTSMIPKTVRNMPRKKFIQNFQRTLAVNPKIRCGAKTFTSEMKTAQHNRGLAFIASSHGMIKQKTSKDILNVIKDYTAQCSSMVNARDMALMSSFLANGGVHPFLKEKIVSRDACIYINALMGVAGCYEESSTLQVTGYPVMKSGVGGVIVASIPGVMSIATTSPPLNVHGTSFRGKIMIKFLMEKLGISSPYSHLNSGGSIAY